MQHRLLKYFIAVSCLLSAIGSLAQRNGEDKLRQLDSLYTIESQAADTRIEKYFKKKPGAGRITYRSDGSIMALIDVSNTGVPIYLKSDNAGVAISLGVDKIQSGGPLGLNLEGLGIKVGIWDEGKVRNDHIEYSGRVIQMDNPTAFNTHSSHVLGTMIATGFNANAKGMAPKATAIAFDFLGDVGEMISQATPDQTSLILSNHSYGTLAGWDNDSGTWTWHGDPSISATQDWKFGFYNQTSRFYDDIAYNAPYYLIVKSAGNDANDVGDGSRDPDCNPFDCIPTNGVAKNILTIGAVKKHLLLYSGPGDIEITSFSSLGPTDDGRIKPDIVAPGQSVFSASANSTGSYTTLSGTSMSAPASTGTLALLQELHKNLNGGNLMKAATLKALVIHTAREAGQNPGPDFRFGWGLLNAEEAAKTLVEKDNQNIFIKELSLKNNEIFELDLEPIQNKKITATLVWTDPAGPSIAASLNPTTKILVNDLDLRLSDEGGNLQFPWKLDGSNPTLAATKGDNIRDNVEKLEFNDPEPRNYKLRVSHKGTLVNGKQDFSLIVSYSSVIDPKVTYYWVGDTGNWNDGAHWSLSSGGIPANVVPTAIDKVVMDENSFSSNGQTVSLTQNQQCYSLRWFANENIKLSFNNNQLAVLDEVNLLTENITTISGGSLLFGGTLNNEVQINLNKNNLKDLMFKFSGQNIQWSLSGDFKINGLELMEGNVMLGNNSINLNSIKSLSTLPKTLTLKGSTITGLTGLAIDLTNILLEGEGNKIIIPLTASYNFNISNNTFNGVLDFSGGAINVVGSGKFESTKGFGTLFINGNHTWNNFSMEGNSIIRMEEASTQTVTSTFYLGATIDKRVTLESLGAMSTLELTGHAKICLDYLDVNSLTVTGQSVLNAGVNSNIINSSNWLQKKCDDVLFSDFEVKFECEKAAVFFVDKSSGPVSSRNWNFGDITSFQNESNSTNPIHYYDNGGQYFVSLEVSDGTNTESYTRPINLASTILLENKVQLSNGKLISFIPANGYQWVLDGEPLPNTNLRSIDLTRGLGLYAVLTFNENCNRQSDTFLVTGIEKGGLTPSVVVYPNPANNLLFVRTTKSHVRNLRLINGMGHAIMVNSTEIEEGWQLDISDVTAGMYILQVQTEFNTSHFRILVE